MKIYLVGGAVRDQLLGLAVTESDYVVVGATPEAMLALGYKPVGKEFPVFLHPKTKEEYALARTERKVGKGYKGFTFHAAPEVSLEEDLKRRDLTINAIAQSEDGKLIDPYHGQDDLAHKVLRHVSPAFAEDPVRILRVARFAARFAEFSIHPSTLILMQQMVAAGEVDALVAERVWQEFSRALTERHPERFVLVLHDCGALAILFPELAAHYVTVYAALQQAAVRYQDPLIRFGAMFFHCDKAAALRLCERYRLPTDYRELAVMVASYYLNYETVVTLSATEKLNLLEKLDAFRRPDRFERYCFACDVIADDVKKITTWQQVYKITAVITPTALIQQGVTGKAISEGLYQLRLAALKKM